MYSIQIEKLALCLWVHKFFTDDWNAKIIIREKPKCLRRSTHCKIKQAVVANPG